MGPTKKHFKKLPMIPWKIGIAPRFLTNLVGVDQKIKDPLKS